MRFICRQIRQIIYWMALIRHKHKYHPKLECGLPISYSTLRLLLIYFYSFISIYILIYASVIGIFQLNLDIVYSLYHLVKMMLIKTEGMADKGTLYIWQTDPHKERKREADISPDSNRYSSVVVRASLKSPNLQNNVILVTQDDWRKFHSLYAKLFFIVVKWEIPYLKFLIIVVFLVLNKEFLILQKINESCYIFLHFMLKLSFEYAY